MQELQLCQGSKNDMKLTKTKPYKPGIKDYKQKSIRQEIKFDKWDIIIVGLAISAVILEVWTLKFMLDTVFLFGL